MFAKTIAERTKPGVHQEIEERGHTFHAFGSSLGLAGIIISDAEYPRIAAHSLLSKIVNEFTDKHPRTSYSSTSVTSVPYPELKEYLQKYQNPEEADKILKIQNDLESTKIELHKTIESVLERGEKIDSLVAKSDGLSAQSKMFYQQAKKQNSCCVVM